MINIKNWSDKDETVVADFNRLPRKVGVYSWMNGIF
jgi:hypothetical protein